MKIQDILRAQRESVLKVAAEKLGRPLTAEERTGVARIESLQMLEAVEQSFGHPSTSASQIAADLRSFAQQENE